METYRMKATDNIFEWVGLPKEEADLFLEIARTETEIAAEEAREKVGVKDCWLLDLPVPRALA